MSLNQIYTNAIVGNKYLLGPQIGCGAFGEVYIANIDGDSTLYAVKREYQKTRHPQLFYQFKLMKLFQNAIGFPKIYYYGNQQKSNFLAMELLGPTLEDLLYICNKRFTLKTVLMLADQMLNRIQFLHSLNYIHRDIKPQNFLVGINEKSHLLYLVDFGLSKKYRDAKTHQHINYKENRSLAGTVRYSSINTHFGFEQSRRDDLESIGYVLLYFAQGGLPWQGVKANNKIQKHEKIQEKKMSTPIEVQCKGLPIQFSVYMNYCKSLKFQEKPDYKFLRKNFKELFDRIGFEFDYNYDWCQLPNKKVIETPSIRLQIEKIDDFIPIQDIQQKRQRIPSIDPNILNQSEINVSFLSDRASQNVPDQSFQESAFGFVQKKEFKSKNLEKNQQTQEIQESQKQ